MNDSLLKKVTFSRSHPKHTQIKGKHVLGDFGRGMLTMISGFSQEDTKNNVDLKFDIKLKSKQSKFSWNINLFCKGQIGKDLDRYQTEDGGHSLSIDHFAHVNWDQGVSGEIANENSKIGEFVLIKYPKFDQKSSKGPMEFLDELKKRNIHQNDFESKNSESTTNHDFAIIGELHGIDFKVVTNMRKQKFWVFQGDTIKAILEKSNSGGNSFGKNYFILVHPEISALESIYWLKTALLAEYLNQTLSTTYYKW